MWSDINIQPASSLVSMISPPVSISASVTNLIQLPSPAQSSVWWRVIQARCYVHTLPNKPFSQNTNIWRSLGNFPKPVPAALEADPGQTSESRLVVTVREEEAWPGQHQHLALLLNHAVLVFLDQPSLLTRTSARRFRDPLCPLHRAPSNPALIVNSHMINLSAWQVGRIEAPQLFPLG